MLGYVPFGSRNDAAQIPPMVYKKPPFPVKTDKLSKKLVRFKVYTAVTIKMSYVRFENFTAVTMTNGVFWDVTPSGSCKNRRNLAPPSSG
jgi:hypothetical protein